MTDSQQAVAPQQIENDLHSHERNRRLLLTGGAIAIVAMTWLAYARTLKAGFIWDDDYHVINNQLLHSLGGLQRIWFDILGGVKQYPLPQYYPMTHTSFWVEYHMWKLNSTGYHATNIALHSLNALLIWLILRKLAVPGAWLAAAIFAVHPMNVESVAWISERKNVLSLFFMLSSMYVYLRYAGVIPPPLKRSEHLTLPEEPERVWALAAAMFFFALMSKTTASAMPAIVLLIIWWKRGRITRQDILPLLPFLVVGTAAGVLTGYMEIHRVGAHGPDWDYSPTLLGEFAARMLIAGRAFWFYVYKLVVPVGLIFNYPRWPVSVASPLQWLFPLGAAAVILAFVWSIRRLGRGALIAMLIFAGTLFPALGFFNVLPMRYAFVADHFAYLPSIALIALVVSALTIAARRWVPREVSATGAVHAVATAVLVIFMLLTVVQTGMYRNLETLWETTIEKTAQRSWFAGNNYGVLLLNRGNVADAERWFDKVLRQKPDHFEALYSLGWIAESRGDIERAKQLYQQSIHLRNDYTRPIFRLGVIAQEEGKLDDAEKLYRRVMDLNSHDDWVRMTLGLLKKEQRKDEEALNLFQAAADINPESAAPYVESANIRIKMGEGDEAMRLLAQAGKLEPNNPVVANNAGILFASNGYWREARIWFQRALDVNPEMVDALTNLAIVAAREGKPEESRQLFERALAINPDFSKARENLAALLAGRLQPATTQSSTAPAGN